MEELREVTPVPIQLIDHTKPVNNADDNQTANAASAVVAAGGVWAKDVHVDDYNLIQGSTKAGAYIVWIIHIEALASALLNREDSSDSSSTTTTASNNNSNHSSTVSRRVASHTSHLRNGAAGRSGIITIRKRYSEFDVFRDQLQRKFPGRRNEIPDLPPKSMLFKFRAAFLESRRKGLEYFLLCVLLNPVFASDPIVKTFVQSD